MIFRAISLAFELYEIAILARVVMTWINVNPYDPIPKFLAELTDPFLGMIERYMPEALKMPLNFTPVVALLILNVLESLIYKILYILL